MKFLNFNYHVFILLQYISNINIKDSCQRWSYDVVVSIFGFDYRLTGLQFPNYAGSNPAKTSSIFPWVFDSFAFGSQESPFMNLNAGVTIVNCCNKSFPARELFALTPNAAMHQISYRSRSESVAIFYFVLCSKAALFTSV